MTATAVSVKLTDDERKRLSAVAKKTKRSAHYLMREAVLSHLENVESRLSFLAEAEEAWRRYKETGIAYSIDEVEAWFLSDRSKTAPWQK
jgi:predicted transcriptional regulator